MKKHILVVGATHGIGKATVQRFLDDGHQVTGIDIHPATISHSNYQHERCDLGDCNDVTRLSSALTGQHITDVVYCAAEQRIFAAADFSGELANRMLTVNVLSAWQLVAHLQKACTSDETHLSSVVLVSSVHAIATSPAMTGYAMTKAAVASLVRSLAIDFSRYGTRVNGIMPGAVRTRMLTDHLTEREIETFVQRQLIPHIADPAEIAGTIAFLTSEDASYITGQNIIVDGGVLTVLGAETD